MIVYPISNYLWLPWKWKMECKNFTSRVEQGYIPNTTSYLQLFMNTIKIKDFCNRYQYEMKNNFCNEHQYEMQKSRDGGGNNAYKIFISSVDQGYIPNTISYVKLFTNTLKIKNNFYNGHQYEMQQKPGWGEGIMPIKSWCAGWRRETYANTKLV